MRGATSYAEVVRMLIRDARRLPQSERGAFPKLHEFKRDKRDRFD